MTAFNKNPFAARAAAASAYPAERAPAYLAGATPVTAGGANRRPTPRPTPGDTWRQVAERTPSSACLRAAMPPPPSVVAAAPPTPRPDDRGAAPTDRAALPPVSTPVAQHLQVQYHRAPPAAVDRLPAGVNSPPTAVTSHSSANRNSPAGSLPAGSLPRTRNSLPKFVLQRDLDANRELIALIEQRMRQVEEDRPAPPPELAGAEGGASASDPKAADPAGAEDADASDLGAALKSLRSSGQELSDRFDGQVSRQSASQSVSLPLDRHVRQPVLQVYAGSLIKPVQVYAGSPINPLRRHKGAKGLPAFYLHQTQDLGRSEWRFESTWERFARLPAQVTKKTKKRGKKATRLVRVGVAAQDHWPAEAASGEAPPPPPPKGAVDVTAAVSKAKKYKAHAKHLHSKLQTQAEMCSSPPDPNTSTPNTIAATNLLRALGALEPL
eukprot:1184012-Prorocentrum_minimum.AAC.2